MVLNAQNDLIAWDVAPLGLVRLGEQQVQEDPATIESPPDAPPRNFYKGRRSQIMSAPIEMAPSWQPPVYRKSDAEKMALRTLLEAHVLLNGLCPSDLTVLLDAFQGLRFLVGATIIKQGDIGESFYILESGSCAISVEGHGVVSRASPGDSFGELALLYDSPRAATVEASERCQCWVLEHVSFKRIVRGNAMQRHARYHAFLACVPVLASLGRYEKCRLLDAIRTQHVREGEEVIREGTYGNAFYIIEEGEVRCTQQASPREEICRRLVSSDFFGERALLSTERRAATVTATRATSLLVLDRETFLRLLGPLEECIKREADRQQRQELSGSDSNAEDDRADGPCA